MEDAAQAIGARYRGTPVGALGALGCFSFFPSKNLGGAGDGGLITVNDPALAQRMRDCCASTAAGANITTRRLGFNSRLDEIQAAVLRVKLKYLGQWTIGRRARAALYRELFAQRGLDALVRTPLEPPGYEHAYNQFVIRCPRRDELRSFSASHGIPSAIYYPSRCICSQLLPILATARVSFPTRRPPAVKFWRCRYILNCATSSRSRWRTQFPASWFSRLNKTIPQGLRITLISPRARKDEENTVIFYAERGTTRCTIARKTPSARCKCC